MSDNMQPLMTALHVYTHATL
uniref:Uncharacterized protein n=1 Tax=Anguilla anguilla TaxID=7936 RepID=A0A0E9Q8C3_ANGAN